MSCRPTEAGHQRKLVRRRPGRVVGGALFFSGPMRVPGEGRGGVNFLLHSVVRCVSYTPLCEPVL